MKIRCKKCNKTYTIEDETETETECPRCGNINVMSSKSSSRRYSDQKKAMKSDKEWFKIHKAFKKRLESGEIEDHKEINIDIKEEPEEEEMKEKPGIKEEPEEKFDQLSQLLKGYMKD